MSELGMADRVSRERTLELPSVTSSASHYPLLPGERLSNTEAETSIIEDYKAYKLTGFSILPTVSNARLARREWLPAFESLYNQEPSLDLPLVYPRYTSLHHRLLSRLGTRIEELKHKIGSGHDRDHAWDELEDLLSRYDRLMLSTRDLSSLNAASVTDHKEFSERTGEGGRWDTDDLASLRPGRAAPRLLSALQSGTAWLAKERSQRGTIPLGQSPNRQTKARLRWQSRLTSWLYYTLSATNIFLLLLLPIIAIFYAQRTGPDKRPAIVISILAVFTLMFAAAVSTLMTLRRHELFAAAAAYCTVVVLFVNNFSGDFQG